MRKQLVVALGRNAKAVVDSHKFYRCVGNSAKSLDDRGSKPADNGAFFRRDESRPLPLCILNNSVAVEGLDGADVNYAN